MLTSFSNYDKARKGYLTREDFIEREEGGFTATFVDRLFQVHVKRHGKMMSSAEFITFEIAHDHMQVCGGNLVECHVTTLLAPFGHSLLLQGVGSQGQWIPDAVRPHVLLRRSPEQLRCLLHGRGVDALLRRLLRSALRHGPARDLGKVSSKSSILDRCHIL